MDMQCGAEPLLTALSTESPFWWTYVGSEWVPSTELPFWWTYGGAASDDAFASLNHAHEDK